MGKRKKIYIKYNAGKVLIKLVIMNIFKEKGYYYLVLIQTIFTHKKYYLFLSI